MLLFETATNRVPFTTAAECGSRLKAGTTWNVWSSLSFKLMFQLDLRAFQPRTLRLRQLLAGAVDIKGQHRQRRAIGAGLAARTVLRRTLQRGRDFLRACQLEDPALEIERVAFLRHALRPAFR